MKMTRCSGPEFHFFDGEKYKVCPVCGFPVAGKEEDSMPSVNDDAAAKKMHKEKEKKKWPFGIHKKEEPETTGGYEIKLDNPTQAMTDAAGPNVTDDRITTGVKTSTGVETVAMEAFKPVDESLSHQVRRIHDIPQPDEPQFQPQMRNEYVQQPVNQQPKPDAVIPQLMPQAEQTPVRTPAINNNNYDSAKTVGIYADAETEPVVGWLVCVKGDECQGESFNLKAGKNMIGRGVGMDVQIPEPTVSRERHAIITYEPKKRMFLIQPGDGSGMVYLNDELLMTFSEIKSRDIIQLGEALFMFYPFCGEDFTWDDYISK